MVVKHSKNPKFDYKETEVHINLGLYLEYHCIEATGSSQCMQVLRDPRQKRFFKAKDMSDLFQLGNQYAQTPETAQIFAGINSEIPLIEAGQNTSLTTPSLSPEGAGQMAGSTPGTSRDASPLNTPALDQDGRILYDILHLLEHHNVLFVKKYIHVSVLFTPPCM